MMACKSWRLSLDDPFLPLIPDEFFKDVFKGAKFFVRRPEHVYVYYDTKATAYNGMKSIRGKMSVHLLPCKFRHIPENEDGSIVIE